VGLWRCFTVAYPCKAIYVNIRVFTSSSVLCLQVQPSARSAGPQVEDFVAHAHPQLLWNTHTHTQILSRIHSPYVHTLLLPHPQTPFSNHPFAHKTRIQKTFFMICMAFWQSALDSFGTGSLSGLGGSFDATPRAAGASRQSVCVHVWQDICRCFGWDGTGGMGFDADSCGEPCQLVCVLMSIHPGAER
jgi:hypothetical protein